MKDFDVRFVLYRLIGDEVVDVDGICLRYTIFTGVSYKSEVNYFTKTLTESGLVYNGQDGLGFECGGIYNFKNKRIVYQTNKLRQNRKWKIKQKKNC